MTLELDFSRFLVYSVSSLVYFLVPASRFLLTAMGPFAQNRSGDDELGSWIDSLIFDWKTLIGNLFIVYYPEERFKLEWGSNSKL